MLRKGRILVDLGKLRNLEAGLGEVSRRFRWDATVRRYLDLYRRLAGLPVPIARTGEA